jgi:hypothetical protein
MTNAQFESMTTDELIAAGLLEAPSARTIAEAKAAEAEAKAKAKAAEADYTDCSEYEIFGDNQILHEEVLRQLHATVSDIDPDGERGGEVYEVRRNDKVVAMIFEFDRYYRIKGDIYFNDDRYPTPESAAVAHLEITSPADTLLAFQSAQVEILERKALPDYP